MQVIGTSARQLGGVEPQVMLITEVKTFREVPPFEVTYGVVRRKIPPGLARSGVGGGADQ